MQQAIRWNLFQLCQATWRVEGAGSPRRASRRRPTRGITSGIPRSISFPSWPLRNRGSLATCCAFATACSRERAIARASSTSSGALFPWRTINGYEASAAYQAGTAQYHLNADIAFAVRRYVNASDDGDFLVEAGAELLVETARMWADLGFYADDGQFHVHNVTGPDEYTTVVNDNTYTNLMARLNLNYAAATLRAMQAERPAARGARGRARAAPGGARRVGARGGGDVRPL